MSPLICPSDFLVHVSNKIFLTDCDQNREAIISDYTGVIIIECSKGQQLNKFWSPGKICLYKRRQKKVSFSDLLQRLAMQTEKKYFNFSLQ